LLFAADTHAAWDHVDQCDDCQTKLAGFENRDWPELAAAIQNASEPAVSRAGNESTRSLDLRLHDVEFSPDRTTWGLMTTTRRIAGYVIGNMIGRGGMGDVFVARRLSDARLVAIKFLRHLSASTAGRFRQEVKAACALQHPNLVAAVDGDAETSHPYLVTEFIDGVDCGQIASLCGPLDHATVCAIAAQVAQALTYLHERQLLHRDVKPSNILIGKDGVVRLSDLGLIQVRDENLRAAETTRTRDFIGTMDYMSPEQMQNAGRTTESSDLYSLAVTMYRLLVGCSPFSRVLCPDRQRALENRLANRIPRISLLVDLPQELAGLIMSAMSSQPELRPVSATAFREAILKWSDDKRLGELATECVSRLQDQGFPQVADSDLRDDRRAPDDSEGQGRSSRRRVVATLMGGVGLAAFGWYSGRHSTSPTQTGAAPQLDRNPSGPLEHLRGVFEPDLLSQVKWPDQVIAAWPSPRGVNEEGISCISQILRDRPIAVGLSNGSVATGDELSLRLQPMSFRSPWSYRTTHIEYSPDGKLLAALSGDGRITLWQLRTGSIEMRSQESMADREGEEVTLLTDSGLFTPLGRLLGDPAVLEHVAWDPTSRFLATGGVPSIIRIWDLKSIGPLTPPDDVSTDFNPYGLRSDVECVKLTTEPTLTSLAFSSDGKRLIAGTLDGELRLFDPSMSTSSPEPLSRIMQHSGRINRILVSSSGSLVLTCGGWPNDRSIRGWTVVEDRLIPLWSQQSHATYLESIAWSHDETRLASVDSGGQLILWELDQSNPPPLTGAEVEPVVPITELSTFQLPLSASGTPRLAFSSDDKNILVTTDTESLICLTIDADVLRRKVLFGDDSQQIRAILPLTDESRLLAGSMDGVVLEWDLRVSPPRLTSTLTSNSEVFALAMKPDRETLMAAGWSSSDVPVWEVREGRFETQGVIPGGGDVLFSCTCSPNGALVAWGGLDGNAVVADLPLDATRIAADSSQPNLSEKPTPTENDTIVRPVILPLSGSSYRFLHPSWVRQVKFNSDGTLLLTACEDQKVRVWSVAPDKTDAASHDSVFPVATFEPPDGETSHVRVQCVLFDDKSATLVAGMGSGKVMLWRPAESLEISTETVTAFLSDAANFQPPIRLDRHQREVMAMAVTGESHLFVASMDGLLTEWQLPAGEFLREWQLPFPVTSLALIHDERYVVMGFNRGVLAVLDRVQP
jgi:serine/threonine protein kinase/WD40 repeat protein